VSTVLLVRHALTAATGTTLSGWTPGVDLNERGREQAVALAARLAGLPLAAIVTSPLERCRQTAATLVRDGDADPVVDDRLGEVQYGEWTGRELKRLAREPMWKVVQAHPDAARFPGGEALRDTQHRAVAAVRSYDERFGAAAVWAVVSHADVIKLVLADALGLHLDLFQRLQVDPCSVSVVRYTPLRPFVLRLNDTGGLADLRPPRRRSRRSSDAVVGGGAGGGAT
jgi:probable phosphomutase (TIGR03848 family)